MRSFGVIAAGLSLASSATVGPSAISQAALRLRGGGTGATLVTGGVGYIGSHTVLELLSAGHEVVVVDNLCNSNIECLNRVQQLAGCEIPFYQVDIRDKEALAAVFAKHEIDAVVHFAGLKAVGESVAKPLLYYQVNVEGTLNLVEVMLEAGCRNIVFSSSATVYGEPASVPVTEDFPTGPTNPYGSSKLFNEQILRDVAASHPDWNVCLLRYFNPVGAHPSGLIGEDPKGIPNNLMPFIQQVAVGKRPHLNVFGSDYPTPDGDPAAPPSPPSPHLPRTHARTSLHVAHAAFSPSASALPPPWRHSGSIRSVATAGYCAVSEASLLTIRPLVSALPLPPIVRVAQVGGEPPSGEHRCRYRSPAGTGVRDYIHVVDLAKGHTAALAKLKSSPGCVTYNLGTGTGYSVLDMLKVRPTRVHHPPTGWGKYFCSPCPQLTTTHSPPTQGRKSD